MHLEPTAQPARSAKATQDQSRQSLKGLANLAEKITPWLFAVGSWIFGGLMAFDLVAISSLITVGPVDGSVRISITAFACALPLNVAGIFLLRLITDMKEIRIDDLTLQAFQEAGFSGIDAYFPPPLERESVRKKRSNLGLLYSCGIGLLSIALTVAGLVAALWHMAWWIAIAFCAAVILSAGLVVAVIAHSLPAETEAEKALSRVWP